MNARTLALTIIDKLRSSGHVAYLAGGCVRDMLLGRDPKDYDVVTDARPPRVQARKTPSSLTVQSRSSR